MSWQLLQSKKTAFTCFAAVLCAVAIGGFIFRDRWLPWAKNIAGFNQEKSSAKETSKKSKQGGHWDDDVWHADKVYDHKHDEATSLQLSKQARNNIGLRFMRVELSDFERTMTIPGMVVERPGRSEREVAAPMTGVITRIYAIEGEAVSPGDPLFDLRLTHEELVQAQGDFLDTVEQLDVVKQEVARLERATVLIAGKRIQPFAGKYLLAQKYEQQKLEARIRAQHQRLVLHGFSDSQVEKIQTRRELLQTLTVSAQPIVNLRYQANRSQILRVSKLKCRQGQQVDAGDCLAVLVDHSELFIEGQAFEKDGEQLRLTAKKQWKLTAWFESGETRKDLKILYLSDHIDPHSRAFRFYVRLPNEIVPDRSPDQNKEPFEAPPRRRFVSWRFSPGQRVDLLMPIAIWTNRIVLPIGAVVKDGAEWYVFKKYGDHFDRRSVHVEYKDQRWAVIAADNEIYPGVVIAGSGASQMLMALKNKSGGPTDPHAGHGHD